jgi:anti-sigma factor RsiW
MKVTRDVIYDLLPAYFSGEISQDTRRLVDEFLEQDPEFRQMMDRFRMVFREPRPAGAQAVPNDAEVFDRARSLLQKRSELRGYVIAFGLATLFILFIVMTRMTPGTSVGPWFIALAFAATALIAGVQLYFMKTVGPPKRR